MMKKLFQKFITKIRLHKVKSFLLSLSFLFCSIFSYYAHSGPAGEVLKETGGQMATGAVMGAASNFALDKLVPKEIRDKIGQWFSSPPGIALLSGVSLGLNTILYNAASEQEDEFKSNSKKIEAMIATFKSTFQDYCPNGRDKLEEPQCYCYTDDGKKNTNRSNSQTCQQLWAKRDFLVDGKKANYAATKSFNDVAGCMTVNGVFDETCRCKKLVDKEGNNACMKASQLAVSLPSGMASFARSSGLSGTLGAAASIVNGNGSLSNYSGAKLALNAANAKNNSMDLLNQLPKNMKGQMNDLAKALTSPVGALELTEKVLGVDTMKAAEASFPKSYGDAPTGQLANAVKSVEQDLKNKGIELVGGAGRGKLAANKPTFKFNDGGSSGGQVLNLPESIPEKKYKIKGDINTNNDVSIWDVISNRYMQSGVRRLMED